MRKELKKGDTEYELFNDYWKLTKEFNIPEDADEYWETFQDALINGNLDDMPEDPEQAASQAFLADFEKFMDDELKDNDCFVVLDCHCFP